MTALSEPAKVVIAFAVLVAIIVVIVLAAIMKINDWMETRETEQHRRTIANWNLVDRLKKEDEE